MLQMDRRGAYLGTLVNLGFINLQPFLDGHVSLVFDDGHLHVRYQLSSEDPDLLPGMIDSHARHADDIMGNLVCDALRNTHL